MTRVVEFEADNDAPAYFEEQTVLEAAVESTDGDGDSDGDSDGDDDSDRDNDGEE